MATEEVRARQNRRSATFIEVSKSLTGDELRNLRDQAAMPARLRNNCYQPSSICRFGLQVVDAVIDAVGTDRTAIRFSPWGTFQGIEYGISPILQFSHVFAELESRRRDSKGLAYVHLVEPRTDATADVRSKEGASNAFIDAIWKGVVVRAGSMRTVAKEAADENNRTIVAIARDFVSNPDLPYRLAHGLELSPYDRDTFYANTSEGYTTYPFAKGFKAGPLVFA
jgi:NADPH2 dehydrogenase